MATTIGDRIRQARQRRGWSQTRLARELKVSTSYVSLLESGRRRPRPQLLERAAQELECPVEYLRTGRGSPDCDDLELELRFAELALRAGDAQTARDRFRQVARRAELLDESDLRCEAEWGLSRAHEALGELEASIEGFERLADGAVQLPATMSRTSVMTALCLAYLKCGDLTRAVDVGESALRDLRSDDPDRPDRDPATELASTLVFCYYQRGDLTRAHLLARTVIEAAEHHGSTSARAAAYWNAAVVAEARGELRSARILTERALALYSETDNARATASLRVNCAWLLLRSPEPQVAEADELLGRALAELTEVGSVVDVASAEIELARCRLLAGDPAEAATVAAGALDRLGSEARLETARAQAVLAHAQLALGDTTAAVATYTAAAGALARLDASREAAATWRELADALAGLGRSEEAMAAYRHLADAAGVPGHPPAPARVATVAGLHLR